MTDKKKILIVDDDIQISEQLKFFLEDEGGFEIQVVNESEKVLAAVQTFRPQIIFMDVVMPHATGGEIAFELASYEELQDIPIVFLTGTITEEEAKQANHLVGGYPMLSKPVQMSQILAMIHKYVPE